THVDWRYLIKRGCLVSNLGVARTHAIKGAESFAANKQVAIGAYGQCSVGGRIVQRRNGDRSLPGNSAVGRALEFHDAGVIAIKAVACLVLEGMPRAVGLIYCKPFLVASPRESVGLQLCPGLAAIS